MRAFAAIRAPFIHGAYRGPRRRGGRVGAGLALARLAACLLLRPWPAAAEPVAEPQGYRMDNFRSPVPLTLKGAKALTGDEAADLWNASGAIFIDVYPQAPKPKNLPAGTFWRDPVHRSIEGAHWLPNVGYGALPDAVEAYFRSSLERLTKGDKAAPIVFFCLRDCWMSWNAAKRALAARLPQHHVVSRRHRRLAGARLPAGRRRKEPVGAAWTAPMSREARAVRPQLCICARISLAIS